MKVSLLRSSFVQSAVLHLSLLMVMTLTLKLLSRTTTPGPQTKLRVPVVIKEVAVAEPVPAQVDLRAPKRENLPLTKKVSKVFGVRKESLTTGDAEAVGVKVGNTLATEVDQKVLKPEEENLPVPTEEYLVTAMPRPLNEFRIPYPDQAKALNIQGVVVMDILVDEKGVVRDAILIEGPGYGLNEAAIEAIKQFKFSPALIEKQPVAVRLRYGYRFVLN